MTRIPFTLQLVDGPCAGTFETMHAPKVLRAVLALDGTPDVLDAPDDTPRLDERVHHYRQVGVTGHLCCRPGGCHQIVDYRHERKMTSLEHARSAHA